MTLYCLHTDLGYMVETRDTILSNNICFVQMHGYADLSVLQSFAKPVKQFFSFM